MTAVLGTGSSVYNLPRLSEERQSKLLDLLLSGRGNETLYPQEIEGLCVRDELILRNASLVKFKCKRYFRPVTLDVLQEGMCALTRAVDTYDPRRGSFLTWALNLVEYRMRDLRRFAKRSVELVQGDDEVTDRQVSHIDPYRQVDLDDELDFILRDLTHCQSDAIRRSFKYGNCAAVARELDISKQAVHQRVSLGLAKARRVASR